MILLFTDFGPNGPYVGQVKTVLRRMAPEVPVVDVMHDAPIWKPRAAAYLLAALAQTSEEGDVWLCVVDPGVGGDRLPIILDCGRVAFVGPDNGLLELIHRRVSNSYRKVVKWRPKQLSATFHGRDLFAPIAAWLAIDENVDCRAIAHDAERPGADWPDNLKEVIYVDDYGNLMTGIGGSSLEDDQSLQVGKKKLAFARTFSDVSVGTLFWHRNSIGLVEIAANQARADILLSAAPGTPLYVE